MNDNGEYDNLLLWLPPNSNWMQRIVDHSCQNSLLIWVATSIFCKHRLYLKSFTIYLYFLQLKATTNFLLKPWQIIHHHFNMECRLQHNYDVGLCQKLFLNTNEIFFRSCERPPYMAISDRLAGWLADRLTGWPADRPRQNQELWLVKSRNVVSSRRSLRLMSLTRWTYAAAGK